MWQDIRLLNATANALLGLLALAILGSALWWVVHRPLFTLREVRLEGPEHTTLRHVSPSTVRGTALPQIKGNFFTADLEQVRVAFESVPWVRRALVQREFPNRLKVVLQEHKPVAFWGAESDARLVNNFGEVFEANQGEVEAEVLPVLNGPQGQAPLVLQAYQVLSPLFDETDASLEQLQLSGQGSWRAQLDNGAVIELGHGSPQEIEARTRLFLATVTQVSSRYGRDLESADLRYGNGYAIRLRGVTTGAPADKEDGKKKR